MLLTGYTCDEFERSKYAERSQGFDVEVLTWQKRNKTETTSTHHRTANHCSIAVCTVCYYLDQRFHCENDQKRETTPTHHRSSQPLFYSCLCVNQCWGMRENDQNELLATSFTSRPITYKHSRPTCYIEILFIVVISNAVTRIPVIILMPRKL